MTNRIISFKLSKNDGENQNKSYTPSESEPSLGVYDFTFTYKSMNYERFFAK